MWARYILEHPENWVIVIDAAYENCGLGGQSSMEHFCGKAGLLWELLIVGRAWPEAVNGAQNA
jgi:hypothetical protein